MNERVTITLPDGWMSGEAVSNLTHTITMTLQKIQKGGGTHFLFTAPPPIAYFGFDKDVGKDVLPKFVDKKQIIVCDYSQHELKAIPRFSKEDKAIQKAINQPIAEEIIAKFESDLDVLLKQPIRTIGIDTETELYEIRRFAEFGAATGESFDYAPVNNWFKRIMGKIEAAEKNLVLVQKLEDVYENNNRTGKLNGKGFKKSHYLTKLNAIIRMSAYPNERDVLPFELEVLDSSHNPLITRLRLQSDPSMPADWSIITGNDAVDRALTTHDKASFPWLGVHVFPDTKLADWV